jgi:hypothetical protein
LQPGILDLRTAPVGGNVFFKGGERKERKAHHTGNQQQNL